ncbi:MAG: DUF2905 domain-containing protein [Desulfobulbus sp.]|nr:DUF2905 domain-containing protein [Desulfobulbus sp.]
MNRILIFIGLLFLVAGLFWPWLRSLPLGRLPGDIVIVRDNVRLFFPLTTCLIVSGILTVLFWLFRK